MHHLINIEHTCIVLHTVCTTSLCTSCVQLQKKRTEKRKLRLIPTLDDKSRVLQNIHLSMCSTFRIYDFNYIVCCVPTLGRVLQPRLLSPFQMALTSGKTRISLVMARNSETFFFEKFTKSLPLFSHLLATMPMLLHFILAYLILLVLPITDFS